MRHWTVKQADKIQLSAMPSVSQFRGWKQQALEEVAAASGIPDEGFAWIHEVDRKDYAELQNSGKLPSLDAKLAAALGT